MTPFDKQSWEATIGRARGFLAEASEEAGVDRVYVATDNEKVARSMLCDHVDQACSFASDFQKGRKSFELSVVDYLVRS